MNLARTLDWQLNAAKIEGLIPFIFEGFDEVVALVSIRRAWRYFDRDFPFARGLDHSPAYESAEIMRSWDGEQRQQFLIFLLHHASPAIRAGAKMVRRAKGYDGKIATSQFLLPVTVLNELAERMPTSDPMSTLEDLVEHLRENSPDFLEIEDWEVELEAQTHETVALSEAHRPESEFWAAGLAVAVRPEILRLGRGPLLVPGIMSKRLFRRNPDVSINEALRLNLSEATAGLYAEISSALKAYKAAQAELGDLYSSSRAFDAWRFAYGIGPVSRLEIARALDVTPKTAYAATSVLVERGLAMLRKDKMLVAKAP